MLVIHLQSARTLVKEERQAILRQRVGEFPKFFHAITFLGKVSEG